MERPSILYILWTNADPITSEKMLLMYATNAMMHHWWDEITVIIWGAPAVLIANNKLIQDKIELAMLAGVKFSACKACADQLNMSNHLIEMGIEVKYWGNELTSLLKDNEKLITI